MLKIEGASQNLAQVISPHNSRAMPPNLAIVLCPWYFSPRWTPASSSGVKSPSVVRKATPFVIPYTMTSPKTTAIACCLGLALVHGKKLPSMSQIAFIAGAPEQPANLPGCSCYASVSRLGLVHVRGPWGTRLALALLPCLPLLNLRVCPETDGHEARRLAMSCRLRSPL